jgi:flagellar motor switch protein FliM
MSEALVTNYDEIAELKGQLAELRKNKEREIRQLEVAIYDGKKEAGVLRQMLAELHEVNAELHREISKNLTES